MNRNCRPSANGYLNGELRKKTGKQSSAIFSSFLSCRRYFNTAGLGSRKSFVCFLASERKRKRRKVRPRTRPNPRGKKRRLLPLERNRIRGQHRSMRIRSSRQRKVMDAGPPATIKTHKRSSARFVRTRPETCVLLAGKGA